MEYDEVANSLRRYRATHPNSDDTHSGPVTDFPRLPESLDTASQWIEHVRALARMWQYPADDAEILAFEAATYLHRHTAPCIAGRLRHHWVTVRASHEPTYISCAWCGGRLGERHDG